LFTLQRCRPKQGFALAYSWHSKRVYIFFQELELQNKDLKERLGLLELQLRHTPAEKESNVVDAEMYENLVKRNKSLQNQLLEVRKVRVIFSCHAITNP
jgi:hypothetical protein